MLDELALIRQLIDAEAPQVDLPALTVRVRTDLAAQAAAEGARPSSPQAPALTAPAVRPRRFRHWSAVGGSDRRQAGRRLALAAASAAVAVVAGGNIAYAASTPPVVPAVPLPGTQATVHAGVPVAVAAIASSVPSTLYLVGDPTRATYGCVTLNPTSQGPPPGVPTSPAATPPAGMMCAWRTAGGVQVPVGIGYGDAIANDRLSTLDGQAVAYGYAPAGTVRVTIHLAKLGPAIFRLFNPTSTVTATVLGSPLGLPIVAWEGPDTTGYQVVSVQAINAAGHVTAQQRW